MASDWIDKRFDELKKLAEERFSPLSEAETKMLRAAIAGSYAWCGPSHENDDPLNDPASKNEWGKNREIRAELLCWLCVDKTAETYVDPVGILIHGARISSGLNLSFAAVRFPLSLRHCRFSNEIVLVSTKLPALVLSGSAVPGISADGAKFQYSVFLTDGFSAVGAVSLVGAQIDGGLECSGGIFRNPPLADMPSSGMALLAERATINGGVHLRNGFVAEGQVSLLGAQIEGTLDCKRGTFKNPPKKDIPQSGTALLVERASIKSSVHLRNGFVAEGQVSLLGAQIGGTLDCGRGIFKNPPKKEIEQSGTALIAERASVKGTVFLRFGFVAEGKVSVMDAQIGGNLDCGGGTFTNPSQADVASSGKALSTENATITGSILLRFGFVADGQVNLLGAQVGGDLDCDGASFHSVVMQRATVMRALFWRNIKNRQAAELDLQGASAGSMVDDQVSWPAAGKLSLEGFTYGRIADGPKDSTNRLEWLGRQKTFAPQPYRQLAKVLRDEGDDAGARHVLYEMEKRKHQDGKHGWPARLWNFVFRWTIGYGIYPRQAVWGLLLLVGLGWGFYGYFAKAMTPTNKEAYIELHDKNQLLPHYPHFCALVYSADNSFPLVNLGQKEFWTPDPSQRGRATFLRIFRWAQILLGWTLATFFVAGVTGIARKD